MNVNERRAEREEAGEDDSEEDETPSGNPAISCHDIPEGNPSANTDR